MQECAQLLGGEQLPRSLLSALMSKTDLDGKADLLALINLTPYDCWVEKVCRKGIDGVKFKTLSLSKSLATAQFVEKSLALELLQDFPSCHVTVSPKL